MKNLSLKKIFLSLAIILAMTTSSVMAAGIGYVDYGKVSTNYSLAKRYTAELDKKLEGIKSYATAQDAKIRAAKSDAERVQINKASLAEVAKRQKEYVALRNKYENELVLKVAAAAEKIRLQKKLDIIIKKDSRVTGGVDCTTEVLNLLK